MTPNTLQYVKLDALCEGLGDQFRDDFADSIGVTFGDPDAKHVLVTVETILHDGLTDFDCDEEQQCAVATIRDRLGRLPPGVLVDLQS